jgi:hypothetical protein
MPAAVSILAHAKDLYVIWQTELRISIPWEHLSDREQAAWTKVFQNGDDERGLRCPQCNRHLICEDCDQVKCSDCNKRAEGLMCPDCVAGEITDHAEELARTMFDERVARLKISKSICVGESR